MKPEPISEPPEPRASVTAWALDELNQDDRAAFEQRLETDPELTALAVETKEFCALLGTLRKPVPLLAESARAELLAAAGRKRRAAKIWIPWAAGAAACIAGGTFFYNRQDLDNAFAASARNEQDVYAGLNSASQSLSQPAPGTTAVTGARFVLTESPMMIRPEMPKPLFAGTPLPGGDPLPNLDRSGKPVLEVEVPAGVALISKGKPVTCSDAAPLGELSWITDGDKQGDDGYFVDILPGKQWIQIDLGQSMEIHLVWMWHFHKQAVIFNDVVVQISDDAEFKSATTVFNNDDDNSSGFGPGKDQSWVETNNGRPVKVNAITGRYVRCWSNGRNIDDTNQYIEVEVYGRAPGPANPSSLASAASPQQDESQRLALEAEREGDRLYVNQDFAGAVEKYRHALVTLPDGQNYLPDRNRATSKYANVSVNHARELAHRGGFDKAKALVESVLAANMAPTHSGALKLRRDLDDPDRFKQELAANATTEEVKKHFNLAFGYYDLGQFKEAEAEFNRILTIDPYNVAARRGLERTEAEVTNYLKAARDHTRLKMLTEADLWAAAIPGTAKAPILDAAAASGPSIPYDPSQLPTGSNGLTILPPSTDFAHNMLAGFDTRRDYFYGHSSVSGVVTGPAVDSLHENLANPNVPTHNPSEPQESRYLTASTGLSKVSGLTTETNGTNLTGIVDARTSPDLTVGFESRGLQTLIIDDGVQAVPDSGGLALHAWQGITAPEVTASESRGRFRYSESQTTPGTESYKPLPENPFRGAFREPLSTFSIDVDTASYSNVRRFLNMNQCPPPAAVRLEELVNYFPYDYPQPVDGKPFAVHVEMTSAPWNEHHRLARIALKGKEVPQTERPSANLVFLVDVSGSMEPENKLPLVKQSLKFVVERLTEKDTVSIVTYAGESGVALRSSSGADKGRITAAIDSMSAGGSTNGAGGLVMAYEQAAAQFNKAGINRVILATDGDFNVGVTSHQELLQLITDKAKSGVFLSVLGYGMGNTKDDTMELLADKGNGNYAYIDSLSEARKSLADQFSGTLVTIAKDVKIQIEFNPAVIRGYRLLGYENRMLAKEDFNNDRKDAGEIGAGHTVTALYELIPVGAPQEQITTVDELKYQPKPELPLAPPPAAAPPANASGETMTVKLRWKAPDADQSQLMQVPVKDNGAKITEASGETRWAIAVAEFAALLNNSQYPGLSWDAVRTLAKSAKGADHNGYRGEFLQLIDKAESVRR